MTVKAAVMGTGSWGTGFGLVLGDAGTDVTMWSFEPHVADNINERHENPDYHPGVAIDPNVRATTDPAEAMRDARIVVLAVPAQTLRENLEAWRDDIPSDAILVSLMKGIEIGTALRMTEVIDEILDVGPDRLVAVSGPNLAKEVAQRQPAATVVACANEEVAKLVQEACHSPSFRPYTNADVVGAELGGAVKNVIALATGMADGLGFGENSKSTVITRGLAEAMRLGAALGADPKTFSGLAGLGDLVATCMSPLSRNRTFGERMGRGETVEAIAESTKQVAEGVKSCESILDLATRNGVEMPIVENVARVIRGDATPNDMLKALLSRETKSEFS
jgi:glycerol-3-phosphate dehydrogenase (NAD(P)+)